MLSITTSKKSKNQYLSWSPNFHTAMKDPGEITPEEIFEGHGKVLHMTCAYALLLVNQSCVFKDLSFSEMKDPDYPKMMSCDLGRLRCIVLGDDELIVDQITFMFQAILTPKPIKEDEKFVDYKIEKIVCMMHREIDETEYGSLLDIEAVEEFYNKISNQIVQESMLDMKLNAILQSPIERNVTWN